MGNYLKSLIIVILFSVSVWACPGGSTDINGQALNGERGIPRVRVVATHQNAETLATTNSFGYFHLTLCNVGDYQLTGFSKQYQFETVSFILPTEDGNDLTVNLFTVP